MTTLPVSLAEIAREGPWALRALGYSFFVADRATRLLVWTEAVHQLGLRFLRLGDLDIRKAAADHSALARVKEGGARRIDARGRCVLDVGPPAMDLATLDARTEGYAHVIVENVSGLCLADALCEIALNRRLGFVLVYASGSQEIGGGALSRSGWLSGIKDEGDPALFGAALDDSTYSCLERFASQLGPSCQESRSRLLADARNAMKRDVAGFGYLAISLFGTGAPVSAAFEESSDEADLPRVDYFDRLVDAQQHGVLADKADLEHLYDLEQETWAPTSDRSRRQAGF